MKKILIALSMIIFTIVIYKEYNKLIIPNESIRIRIIGNSNSINDQLIKLKVKKKIETQIYKDLKETTTINEARKKIIKTIPELNKTLSQTLKNENFSISFGKNYFPSKEMYGINYDAGTYESLVINIGESKGNNWWCVLFPPLCLIEVNKSDKDFVEYKSKVLEILNNYK